MSGIPKADVILTADRDAASVLRSVQNVLENSGSTLRRLIVVGDPPREANVGETLENRSRQDPRLVFVGFATKQSVVESFNRGLTQRLGDVVLLGGEGMPGEGWLGELAGVAHSEESVGCAIPASHSQDDVLGPAKSNGIVSKARMETAISNRVRRPPALHDRSRHIASMRLSSGGCARCRWDARPDPHIPARGRQ